MDSVGDIAFGMEDGAVSIAGLVFGVAFSVHTNAPVILAGPTGATAAAIGGIVIGQIITGGIHL